MESLDYSIVGDDMQAITFKLKGGQKVRAEAGTMLYMDNSIEMETSTGGGILKGLKRAVTGETFFITTFKCTSGEGEVSFSGPYPGKIIPVEVSPAKSFLCQKDSFLCSAEGVEISIALTRRLGAGFFGGEGFILQKLEGSGRVFLHSGGTIVEKDLKPGEELRVDTGCIVAFESSVDYDIKFVGGVKTALFGGEGLFFATLKGPGKVFLQTLPFSRLADRVISASRVGSWSRDESRRGSKVLGALGDVISGD